RIGPVEGRLDDSFDYDGQQIHAFQFSFVIDSEPHVTEYQVEQTSRGARIRLKATGPIDVDLMRAKLEREFAMNGIRKATVAIDIVSEIPRQQVGKLRHFIPLPERK